MFIKFLRSRRGSVLPTFAIAALPLVAATGAVVDYTRAFEQRAVVQGALDSAVLAAGKKIGLLTTDQVKAEANNFYLSNIGDKLAPPTLSTSIVASTITGTTDLRVPTYFLGIVGLDAINFHMLSSATLAMGTLEVAMVLDNSGSMAGTKISTLITAATNLTNTLYNLGSTSTKPDPVKVALVPFAGSVNVGASNKNAAWMDTTGVSPYNSTENLGAARSNFDLFTYTQTAWAGCVLDRPLPYDATDDPATTTIPKTMFVPMFALDEPDTWTCTTGSGSNCNTTGTSSNRAYSGAPGGTQAHNNYLPDNGYVSGSNYGACSTTADKKFTGGNQSTEGQAFQKACKYGSSTKKTTPTPNLNVTTGGTYPGGPNYNCTTGAITPLTPTKSVITGVIAAMKANGTTNISSGVGWGWRVLSPGAPFTEGRAYSVNDNQKILILMTDGDNTYFDSGKSLTDTTYSAWGYGQNEHLGTGINTANEIMTEMNARTATVCANVKAAKIKIYTVAFQVTNQTTLQMLTDCASDPSMAYQSSSTSALLAAFTAIGDDISLLRVAQ